MRWGTALSDFNAASFSAATILATSSSDSSFHKYHFSRIGLLRAIPVHISTTLASAMTAISTTLFLLIFINKHFTWVLFLFHYVSASHRHEMLVQFNRWFETKPGSLSVCSL